MKHWQRDFVHGSVWVSLDLRLWLFGLVIAEDDIEPQVDVSIGIGPLRLGVGVWQA